VAIIIDEAHELFLHDKEIAANAERLIKRGRALGLIIVLATQIPDAKSVPPNITRCVTVRWCLAVQDQVANDMILGTGSYKRGLSAAVYRPGIDAGWGIAVGLTTSGPVRSHYPSHEQTKALVDRATFLRGGIVGQVDDDDRPVRDIVDDVLDVYNRSGAKRLHRQELLDQLVEFWPSTYAGWTVDMLGEALRRAGVPVVDVKVNRVNNKGVKIEDVRHVHGQRAIAAEVAAEVADGD
jgi:S-DNA-T family DNA segregation ATPase FtsK/SpoIIIE